MPYVLPTPSPYWELATEVLLLSIPNLKLSPGIETYVDLGHILLCSFTFPPLAKMTDSHRTPRYPSDAESGPLTSPC